MPVQAQNSALPLCEEEPYTTLMNTSRLHVNQYFQAQTPENAARVITDGKQLEQILSTLAQSPDNICYQALNDAIALSYQQQGEIYATQGHIYQLQGEYEEASESLKKAIQPTLKSWELTQSSSQLRHLPEFNEKIASTLLDVANTYQSQGQYNEAAPLLEKSRELIERSTANISALWPTLTHLADRYQQQPGGNEPAKTLLLSTLDQLPPDNNTDSPIKPIILTHLGQLYQQQGRYLDAERYYQQSIALIRKNQHQSPLVTTLIALASLYMEQKAYDKAAPLLQNALNAQAQSPTENPSKFEQAVQTTVQASLLEMQANNDLQLGKYAEARNSFQQNINNPQNLLPPVSPGSKANALEGLAKLYALKPEKDIPAALAALQQAFDQYAAHPTDDLQQATKQQGLARSHLWLLSLGLQTQQIKEAKVLPAAFIAMQLAHGGQRTQALSHTALRLAADSPAIRDALKNLWKKQADLKHLDKQYAETLSMTGKTVAEIDALYQAMGKTTHDIQKLDALLRQAFPLYAQQVRPEPLPLAQVQALLQPDEALMIWVLSKHNNDQQSCLLLVRPGRQAKLYPLDLNHKVLQKTVNDTRLVTSLADPQQPFDLMTANGLYQQLFAPAANDLEGVQHILAVPDSALQNLPLHLLVKTPSAASKAPSNTDYANADWLAHHYAFSYLPSVHALADLRKSSATRHHNANDRLPFIGFGDAILRGNTSETTLLLTQLGNNLKRGTDGLDFFPDPSPLSSVLHPLPETATELGNIARLLTPNTPPEIYLAQAATEHTLKQMSREGKLRRSRIISFATHALFPSDEAQKARMSHLEPGLVLTPPTQGTAEDDGYLSASEIIRLELDADWVLLSACNTGTLTKQDANSGLSALSKAFFGAGARSVLASLGSVNSQSTEKLMTHLFNNLHNKPTMRRAEALRQSMLTMLAEPAECGWRCWLHWQAETQPAHPAYWAPFVIYGEGGTLQ